MFIDLRQFDFVMELEAAWETIRDEYPSLPEVTFEPWVQREMYGVGDVSRHDQRIRQVVER
jgi:beta-hydroxylase